jgi:hypothetical protein
MKKKQKRTLTILLVMVAVLVGVFLIAKFAGGKGSNSADTSADTSATSAAAGSKITYTALSYGNGTATLSFAQDDDGTWYWTGDQDFPLNNDYITKLINTITNLVPQTTITDGDPLDAYGLKSPTVTLTATESDGTKEVIALGNEVPDGSGNYYMLMNGDQSTVYVVDSTLHSELSLGIYQMMTLPELPILTEDRITSIEIQGTCDTVLTASKKTSSDASSSAGSGTTVTWKSSGADVTGNKNVTALISEISALSISACKDYKPSEAAASLCGFDTPRAVLTLHYTNDKGSEKTLSLTVGSVSTDSGSCYVRLGGDSTIYTMTSDSLSTLVSIASSGLSGGTSD